MEAHLAHDSLFWVQVEAANLKFEVNDIKVYHYAKKLKTLNKYAFHSVKNCFKQLCIFKVNDPQQLNKFT